MARLIPMCGLPRTGSTLLVNLLNQNPDVTISPDSQLSPLIQNIQGYMNDTINESQFKSDQTYEMYKAFYRGGIEGWINAVADTKYFVDKCRSWGFEFDLLFNLFPDIKVIYTIRDLRGIFLSLDKISQKTILPTKEEFYNCDNFDFCNEDLLVRRCEHFFEVQMMRRPLLALKELLDLQRNYVNNIKIVKYENVINNTHETLNDIYDFLEIPRYYHDLNNIKQGYYHDCIFLPYGHHKIKSKMSPKIDNYSELREDIQDKIKDRYYWYYDEFYRDQL